eukprot:m.267919 g.267919  ORF g.267919 m.267919 type:complete len:314 (+) comp34842_c0_seq1:105-1046(+)
MVALQVSLAVVCLLALAQGEDPPKTFVQCETTKGNFTIQLERSWAPLGVARFLSLVERQLLDGTALFRVVPGFLVQFGIPNTKAKRDLVNSETPIKDDPDLKKPFTDGFISFAGSGPNSRNGQLFIAHGDQPGLGTSPWERPLGFVLPGDMHVVRSFYSYGDMAPWGGGPSQQLMSAPDGYENYLVNRFPKLDYIFRCKIQKQSKSRSSSQDDIRQKDKKSNKKKKNAEQDDDDDNDGQQEQNQARIRKQQLDPLPVRDNVYVVSPPSSPASQQILPFALAFFGLLVLAGVAAMLKLFGYQTAEALTRLSKKL